MRDATTTRFPATTPAARLITALGLRARAGATVQDLYSRPPAAVRSAAVPDARRSRTGPGRAAA